MSNVKSSGYRDEYIIKMTFKKYKWGSYSITELKDWFGSKEVNGIVHVIDRILNMTHYQKSKFEANDKFRIVSDDNDCNCDGH